MKSASSNRHHLEASHFSTAKCCAPLLPFAMQGQGVAISTTASCFSAPSSKRPYSIHKQLRNLMKETAQGLKGPIAGVATSTTASDDDIYYYIWLLRTNRKHRSSSIPFVHSLARDEVVGFGLFGNPRLFVSPFFPPSPSPLSAAGPVRT